MGFAFNPFTGNFDVKGAGGGGGSAFFAGEVATYADLPLDGTAPLDSRWLVRSNSGTWPFSSYKQAGVYVRIATVGSSRDNDYRLTDTSFHDVMSDSAFLIFDDGDATKNLKFQLSGIGTATTRTLTVPNASGRIQVEGQAIGDTTPAAGTFTTLAANNGTLTASAPVLDLAQTWNNSAPTYKTMVINVTNTGGSSTANNYPLEIQSGGTAVASIALDGRIRFSGTLATGSGTSWATWLNGSYNNTTSLNSPLFVLGSGGTGAGALGVRLQTEGVEHVLALRNATAAQEFRIYNTFTSATNFERGFLRWNANVFEIGTEEGSGGGSRRDLRLKTGVGAHVDIMQGGNTLAWRFNSIGELVPNATNTRDFGNVSTRVRTGFFENLFVGTKIELYNARSSATNFERLNIRKDSNEFILDAEAGSAGGTLRGIKIGSSTSSLLGFYGVTPVDQPATVTDPTGGGTQDAEARTAINAIIDRLQELGLIA